MSSRVSWMHLACRDTSYLGGKRIVSTFQLIILTLINGLIIILRKSTETRIIDVEINQKE